MSDIEYTPPVLTEDEQRAKRERLIDELRSIINRNSAENGSDTPDFILATFLSDVLAAFDKAIAMREAWYGRK